MELIILLTYVQMTIITTTIVITLCTLPSSSYVVVGRQMLLFSLLKLLDQNERNFTG